MLDQGKKILKKLEKEFKKLKNLFQEIFLAKTGWDRPRKGEKNFSPELRSYSTRARKFQKKEKKSKNWKTSLANTRWDRPKKRKKN